MTLEDISEYRSFVMPTQEQDIIVFHMEKGALGYLRRYPVIVLSVHSYQSGFNQILITSKEFLQDLLIVSIQNYQSRPPHFICHNWD